MTVEAAPLETAPANPSPARQGFEFTRFIRASGYIAVVFALASAAATFFILMGLTPIAPTPDVVLVAMLVNGGLVGFLVLVVAWEIVSLILANRRGRAAGRLHIRIVVLFSLVSAAPAVLLAVTASFSLDRGLDNWFSTRTRAIVDNSLSIARAYAEQQATLLRTDVAAMKAELERGPSLLAEDPARFRVYLSSLAEDQHLPGVFIVDNERALVAQADTARQNDFPPPVQQAVDQAARNPSQVILITPGASNIIGGVTALRGYPEQ
jgi:two-component system nitrogen regulation sensor histidine kinase NtrY